MNEGKVPNNVSKNFSIKYGQMCLDHAQDGENIEKLHKIMRFGKRYLGTQ